VVAISCLEHDRYRLLADSLSRVHYTIVPLWHVFLTYLKDIWHFYKLDRKKLLQHDSEEL